jgi:hypothetical protein
MPGIGQTGYLFCLLSAGHLYPTVETNLLGCLQITQWWLDFVAKPIREKSPLSEHSFELSF